MPVKENINAQIKLRIREKHKYNKANMEKPIWVSLLRTLCGRYFIAHRFPQVAGKGSVDRCKN